MDPINSPIEAKGSANLTMNPLGSGIVICMLFFVCMACLIPAYLLLRDNNHFGLLFILLSALLGAGAVFLISKSQRDQDLANAAPINMSNRDGVNISLDARLAPQFGTPQEMWGQLGAILNRQPLPMPSGMLDKNGQMIPNSANQAQEIIKETNQRAAEINQTATERLRQITHGTPSITQTPPTNIPSDIQSINQSTPTAIDGIISPDKQ